MAIISNKKNGSVTVHNVANATYIIAGNNSVSNVAIDNEVLTGATIKKIVYGSDTGHWTISRGSNTVSICSGTGSLNFTELGTSLNLDSSANLVLTLNGTVNGFIMVELAKVGTLPSTY